MKRFYQYIMMCVAGGVFAACGTDQEPEIRFPITEINQVEEIFVENLTVATSLFTSDEAFYFSTDDSKFYSFRSGASSPEEIPITVENGASNEEELLIYQIGLRQAYSNVPGGSFWQGGKGHFVTSDKHYTYSPDTKTWTVEGLAQSFIDHGTDCLSNMVVIGDVAYQLSLTCLYKYSLTTREWSYTYVTHNFFGNGGVMPSNNYLFAVGDVLYAFDQDEKILYAYDAGRNLWNGVFSLPYVEDYSMATYFMAEHDGVFYIGRFAYYDDDNNSVFNIWKYNANDGQASLMRMVKGNLNVGDFACVLGNNLYLFGYDVIYYFPIHA